MYVKEDVATKENATGRYIHVYISVRTDLVSNGFETWQINLKPLPTD